MNERAGDTVVDAAQWDLGNLAGTRPSAWRTIVSVLLVTAFAACGSPAAPSREARCATTCRRANTDPECTPVADCSAYCVDLVGGARGASCPAQIEAFVACYERTTDLCTPPGSPSPCQVEYAAVSACSTGGDAGL